MRQSYNPLDLSNKKILVAGIGSETSFQIVNTLLKLGASVVVVDENQERYSEILNRVDHQDQLSSFLFNIYDIDGIEQYIKKLSQEFGSFDGFVFSGGIGGVRPLALTKHDFLHKMMNANFYAFIELTRCISKKSSFTAGGSIVAISSVSSIKGLKAKTAYSASKAALDAAIKNIAAELSDRKIRVNSILKGWVSSDLELDFIKSNMELNAENDLSKQLLGVIEPVEIANTVAFLLSDATKTLTGTNLLLDGGYTL